MKNYLLVVSCFLVFKTAGLAYSDKILIEFEPYSQIELNGNFEVLLVQGDKEEVLIEGQDYPIEDLIVEQNRDRIIIGPKYKEHLKNLKKVHLTLYFKTLEELELNGIGEVQCKRTIISDRLHVESNGIKNMTLDLEVGELTAEIDGIGNTYLLGRADLAEIEISGIGNLRAYDMAIGDLRIESSGIGKAEIYATDKLVANASGIGSIKYRGHPTFKRVDSSGIGRVKQVD